MVNKERRFRKAQRAKNAILGAGIVAGIVALLGAIHAMTAGSTVGYISAFFYLALAVFFVLFQHPAFGIAYTVFYLVERVAAALKILGLLAIVEGYAVAEMTLTVGAVLGLALAGGLLALFIYADYQAFVLRGLEKSEEDE